MKDNYNKVIDYVLELGYSISNKDQEDQIIIIDDEKNGIKNCVIGCADPILIIEQYLLELSNGDSSIFEKLLKKNRDIIHGAFVLDESGKRIIFRDTLQIDNLDLNVSTFITLDNAKTQKLGLNQQESANFISKLFTSEQEKGIIPIGSKVMVYKIMEQKLISLESNETDIMHENTDKVKNQGFQASLMEALDKKYPTKLY